MSNPVLGLFLKALADVRAQGWANWVGDKADFCVQSAAAFPVPNLEEASAAIPRRGLFLMPAQNAARGTYKYTGRFLSLFDGPRLRPELIQPRQHGVVVFGLFDAPVQLEVWAVIDLESAYRWNPCEVVVML